MHPEEETRRVITHNFVKTLAPSVQKFYNRPSCAIIVENTEHLDEVVSLLKKLITKL